MGRFENFTPVIQLDEITFSEETMLSELVSLANSSSGQFIRKEAGSLVNATLAEAVTLTGLSDVTISNPANNEIVAYNGTSWVNRTASDVLGTTGTVTSVSVVTANGISGTVATATTTPAITLSLNSITPSAVQISGLTASEIVGTDASKNLVSLAVATYPSLTELTYVKGVTSAIQTQLGLKAPLASPTFTGTVIAPLILGGTSTTQDLSFQTTSGVGATGADMHFLVGNNGATEAMTILNSGNVGVGATTPSTRLQVAGTSATDIGRFDIGIDLNPVTSPTTGGVALINSAGNVDNGSHYYWVTFTTAIGETNSYLLGSVTTDAANGQVTVTIPVSNDYRVTGRKIYRTKAGTSNYTTFSLVSVANNTDTTYVDNVADASLTGTVSAGFYQINTTNKNIMMANSKIMVADINGTHFGVGAGLNVLGGGNNTLFGYNAGKYITSGNQNVLMGNSAGGGITTGGSNVVIGPTAGGAISTGGSNVMIGRNAANAINGSSAGNTVLGYYTFASASSGVRSNNTALGIYTGQYNTGSYNIFIGSNAGNNETGSNTLLIDNLDRTTEALGRTSALIYGVTNATPASQILSLGGGGNVGIGTTTPSAYLHLKAGTATANTAPIKLTAGVVNTTPEAGTVEFDGTDWYLTV